MGFYGDMVDFIDEQIDAIWDYWEELQRGIMEKNLKNDIRNIIVKHIEKTYGSAGEVKDTDTFRESCLDSLDMVEIVMDIEKHTGQPVLDIPDINSTIGDAVENIFSQVKAGCDGK